MKIAREGWPFVAVLAVLGLAAGALLHPWAAAPLLVAALFSLWFFRDPERATPDAPEALVSPADGRILRGRAGTISIFMNVFDVHVCRTPIAGTVEAVQHTPGSFLAAHREPASEHNERVSILVADGRRRVCFTLVAGLVARRIVCKVTPGQRLRAGERVGLIRFGSRVDVDLPSGCEPAVRPGQKVLAGETLIARMAERHPVPGPGEVLVRDCACPRGL